MQATTPQPHRILNTFADALGTALEANSSRPEALSSYSSIYDNIKNYFINDLNKTDADASQWVMQCHSINNEVSKLNEIIERQPEILKHCCSIQITDPEINIAQQTLRAIINHPLEINHKLPTSINHNQNDDNQSGIKINFRGTDRQNRYLRLDKNNPNYAITLCNLLSDREVHLDHTNDNSAKQTFKVGQLITSCIMPLGIEIVDRLLEKALPKIMNIRSKVVDVQTALKSSNAINSLDVANKVKIINGKIRTAQLVIDWLEPIFNTTSTNQASNTSRSSIQRLSPGNQPSRDTAQSILGEINTMLDKLNTEIKSSCVTEYLNNKNRQPCLANAYSDWITTTQETLSKLIPISGVTATNTANESSEQTAKNEENIRIKTELQTEIDRLKKQNETLNTKSNKNVAELRKLREFLASFKSQSTSTKTQLQTEIDKLKKQNETLNTKSNNSVVELRKLEESNIALQDQSKSLQNQLRQLQENATTNMSKIGDYFRNKNIMAQRFTDTGKKLLDQCKHYKSIMMAFGGLSSIALFTLSYTLLSTASSITSIGALCMVAGAALFVSNFYLALAGDVDYRTDETFQISGDFLRMSEIQTESQIHVPHRQSIGQPNDSNTPRP